MFTKKSSPRPSLLPLHKTSKQREIERAEAIWAKSRSYRPILILIYVAAFLFFFHFLAGMSFTAALWNQIRASINP